MTVLEKLLTELQVCLRKVKEYFYTTDEQGINSNLFSAGFLYCGLQSCVL